MVQRQLSLFLFLLALCLGVWGYILSVNQDFRGIQLLPWSLTLYGNYLIYVTVVVGLLFLITLFTGQKENNKARVAE